MKFTGTCEASSGLYSLNKNVDDSPSLVWQGKARFKMLKYKYSVIPDSTRDIMHFESIEWLKCMKFYIPLTKLLLWDRNYQM